MDILPALEVWTDSSEIPWHSEPSSGVAETCSKLIEVLFIYTQTFIILHCLPVSSTFSNILETQRNSLETGPKKILTTGYVPPVPHDMYSTQEAPSWFPLVPSD